VRLSEAKTRFLDFIKSQGIGYYSQFPDLSPTNNVASPSLNLETLESSLNVLTAYFQNFNLSDITACRLREFLCRWYVEEATTSALNNDSQTLPTAGDFLTVLQAFFSWAEDFAAQEASNHLALFNELTDTLPSAIALGVALSQALANRGGAFLFPEFLTSFEAGGHSEYDIGAGGKASAREGYFRILKVEGNRVEAEDVLLEETLAPILFPDAVAPFLKGGYLINMELLYAEKGWQILQCGFAYPPNTEV
jgi:hypothetical protein